MFCLMRMCGVAERHCGGCRLGKDVGSHTNYVRRRVKMQSLCLLRGLGCLEDP